jgi:4-amino-4-deoxy-L-arabinose transferase-like glycosyltransferase
MSYLKPGRLAKYNLITKPMEQSVAKAKFPLMKSRKILICLLLFILTVIIYYLSDAGNTPYDYFTKLSVAMLHGRIFLTNNPAWFNELIPLHGVFYVVYPPMPAILMLPAVLLFGQNFSQTLFSIFLGSLNVVLVYLLSNKLQFGQKTSFILALFLGFGTNHWYLANVGSAWYIAHIVALFFLLLALLESFGKGRLFLVGLLLGASYWARTPEIFSAGFFYLFFWRKILAVR